VGKTYQPLFPYFKHLKGEGQNGSRGKTGAFRVVSDRYVTDSDGTGVVHQAPFFGEDDLRVCLAHGTLLSYSINHDPFNLIEHKSGPSIGRRVLTRPLSLERTIYGCAWLMVRYFHIA
jgi:isoleucyl-tRNA synthetase